MGAWGAGAFENDEALDWMSGLLESDDAEPVANVLLRLSDDSGVIEADDGAVGLAAAEITAATRGYPADSMPDDLREWAQAVCARTSSREARTALQTIDRIEDADSVLSELWASGDSAA